MEIHVIPLLVILGLSLLAAWANRKLVPQPIQNWVYVGIVVIGILFALGSLGLIGGLPVSVGAR